MPESDSQYVSSVLKYCEGALQTVVDDFSHVSREAADFTAPAVSLISGGKRTRARLAHFAWRCAGGHDSHHAIVAAGAALELFQAAALIHDDVIDDAPTRRGAPAAHRVFSRMHRASGWLGDSTQYGHSASILVGDLLLAISQGMMAKAVQAAPVPSPANAVYSQMCAEVALGQYLDITAAAHGPTDSRALERSFVVVRHKSARYSVERPLVLGATLAGGGVDLIDSLSALGEPLGEAFQLRDDELGVFGDPAITGKPAGDDLAEGKLTPLILLGCEMAGPADSAFVRKNLGDRGITSSTVDRIRRILRDSGALSRHEDMITERYQRAVSLISTAPISAEQRREGASLAASLTSRAF